MRPEPTAADAVRALKGRFGSIIVWGSLSLANALLEAGLVDRLRLRITPSMIGDGLRSRTDERRATEVAVGAHALNRMLELGRPSYVRVT